MTTPKLLSDAELKEIEQIIPWLHQRCAARTSHGRSDDCDCGSCRAAGFLRRSAADRAALTAVPMGGEVEKWKAEVKRCDKDVQSANLYRQKAEAALAKANGELNATIALTSAQMAEAASTIVDLKGELNDARAALEKLATFDYSTEEKMNIARTALHPNSEGQNR